MAARQFFLAAAAAGVFPVSVEPPVRGLYFFLGMCSRMFFYKRLIQPKQNVLRTPLLPQTDDDQVLNDDVEMKHDDHRPPHVPEWPSNRNQQPRSTPIDDIQIKTTAFQNDYNCL